MRKLAQLFESVYGAGLIGLVIGGSAGFTQVVGLNGHAASWFWTLVDAVMTYYWDFT